MQGTYMTVTVDYDHPRPVITSDRYPVEEEIEEYLQWKAHFVPQIVDNCTHEQRLAIVKHGFDNGTMF